MNKKFTPAFSWLILHWNRKHEKACYVPSMSSSVPSRRYKYGDKVIAGTGTSFVLFLQQISLGNIYYDPGIKLENMSTRPKTKRRSQFRMKSGDVPNLYSLSEIVDLTG